jgi:Flp pilus assembly pilin Flp
MSDRTAEFRQAMEAVRKVVVRFATDDRGQDLIEYAMITAFFGIVGALFLQGIQTAIGTTYDTWLNPAVGVPSLWTPNEPMP